MLSRARPADPGPPPPLALAAAVDQVLALCRDAVRRNAANRQLCDLALDVTNTLVQRPQPDVPVIPGR